MYDLEHTRSDAIHPHMRVLLRRRPHQADDGRLTGAIARHARRTHLAKDARGADLSTNLIRCPCFSNHCRGSPLFNFFSQGKKQRLTILPPLPVIALTWALMQAKTPRAFTAKLKSQSASVMRVTGQASVMTPAMLTAPSSLPSLCTVDWIHASIVLLSRTSMTWAMCRGSLPPLPGSDSSAVDRAFSFKSAREMMAPREARSLAVARPMPEAAPVMAI